MDYGKIDARLLLSAGLVSAGLAGVAPASAALITYNVNLNFNPLVQEAPPGAGSIGMVTGTFTIDTSISIRDSRIAGQTGFPPTNITTVDLTEKTNDGQAAIGGAFGSPTYSTFTFNETGPVTRIFFGSPIVFQLTTAEISQNSYEFGGQPFIFVSFQTNDSYFDGTLIGPSIQFDFPYPQGGDVTAGNFDSITSETKYLYGSVVVVSGVPELSTWTLILLGFAGLAGVGSRTQSNARRRAEAAF